MDTDIKIEQNVPVPNIRKSWKYPYDKLAIGDSFVITDANMQTVCNLNNRNGKKYGNKYIARREDNGIRVWRQS